MELVLLGSGVVALVALIIYNRWRLRSHASSVGGVSAALFERHTRQALHRLQKHHTTAAPLSSQMLPHHGYPDAEQWLILLHYAPAEAQAILQQLRHHTHTKGVLSSVSAISSLVDYEAVQRFLAATTLPRGHNKTSPEQQQALPITYLEYPDQQQWSQMLRRDRSKALDFYSRILQQQAYLGLEAPAVIEASITAFQRAQQAQPS